MGTRNLGIPIIQLKDTDPDLYGRIETHFGQEYLSWTAGEIEHYAEINDPRSLAAEKNTGDFTARGGKGPERR